MIGILLMNGRWHVFKAPIFADIYHAYWLKHWGPFPDDGIHPLDPDRN